MDSSQRDGVTAHGQTTAAGVTLRCLPEKCSGIGTQCVQFRRYVWLAAIDFGDKDVADCLHRFVSRHTGGILHEGNLSMPERTAISGIQCSDSTALFA